MRTAGALMLATLTTLAAERPKEPPRAGWPGVYPDLTGYARTFEAPTVMPGERPQAWGQAARYEWTGGALKSLTARLGKGPALAADALARDAKEVLVGKRKAWLSVIGEGRERLLRLAVPLGDTRALVLDGKDMLGEQELLTLAGRFDLDAVAAALEQPPRTDFTRNKEAFARLKKGMTLGAVTAWVGDADADVGSGIHIMQYKLPDGGEVLIGFPSFDALLYVKYRGRDGKVEDLVK
jgi:hypothetical protein